MNVTIEVLKQRRIWAGICAFVAFILPFFGVSLSFNVEGTIDSIMKVIEAVSGLLAIILPIISYFRPKS